MILVLMNSKIFCSLFFKRVLFSQHFICKCSILHCYGSVMFLQGKPSTTNIIAGTKRKAACVEDLLQSPNPKKAHKSWSCALCELSTISDRAWKNTLRKESTRQRTAGSNSSWSWEEGEVHIQVWAFVSPLESGWILTASLGRENQGQLKTSIQLHLWSQFRMGWSLRWGYEWWLVTTIKS